MSYDSNVYYHPEKHGLETVGELTWYEPDYSFDFTVVWTAGRGKYYLASDSGCSCPSPFEDYNSLEDLEGPMTKAELESRLKFMIDEHTENGYGRPKAELIKDMRAILGR